MDSFKFVNSLNSNRHLFQAITDSKNATKTQLQFINNGLLKNEYCIYLTHENPNKIKNKMREFGINVDKFTKNGLLHIHTVPDLLKHPSGSLVGFQEFFNKILPNPEFRFRIVGRAVKNLATERGRKAEMEIEQFVHSSFDKMNGMILCNYEYEKLGGKGAMSFVLHILNYHDGAIFSTICEPNFAYDINR